MSARRRTPGKRRRGPGLLSPGAAVVALLAAAGVLFVAVAIIGGGGAGPSAGQDPSTQPARTLPDSQKVEKHVADPAADGPRVHFATTEIDMGVVPLATNVSYSFSFANTGTGKLRLSNVFVRVIQGC